MDVYLPIDLRIENKWYQYLFGNCSLAPHIPNLPIGVFARNFCWNSSMRGLIGRFWFEVESDAGGGGDLCSSFEWNRTFPKTNESITTSYQ